MLIWRHSASYRFVTRFLFLAFALSLTAWPSQAGNASRQAADAPKPQEETRPFRFIVYGDTRDGHEIHRKLVKLILANKPDIILQTGDLVHNGSEAGLWKIYDGITGEMRHLIPVYPARGNHDLGGPGYEERITRPFTSGNKLYYSFDKRDCHFVSVDCFSPFQPGSSQYTWLEKDLAAARKKAQPVFVFFHEPPYSIGSHGSNLEIRSALCPLFVKYGVRAVFNGHDHIYYRTVRDGITYVVSGGGGAPLYPCDPNKGAIPGDSWASVHHIVVCDMKGDTCDVTALRIDGSTLDHFTVKTDVSAR